MTEADAKVLGYSATPSRASWWLSACRFFDASRKSHESAGRRIQSCRIITVSPVPKEPAPLQSRQATNKFEVDDGGDLVQDVVARNISVEREADVELRLGRLATHHGRHRRVKRWAKR